MLPGPWWSPHSANQVKSEPRQALCQFAVSFGIISDHDVVNISCILHFLPFCLALPCTDSVGPLSAVSKNNERLIQEITVNILHSAESWQDDEDEADRD